MQTTELSSYDKYGPEASSYIVEEVLIGQLLWGSALALLALRDWFDSVLMLWL